MSLSKPRPYHIPLYRVNYDDYFGYNVFLFVYAPTRSKAKGIAWKYLANKAHSDVLESDPEFEIVSGGFRCFVTLSSVSKFPENSLFDTVPINKLEDWHYLYPESLHLDSPWLIAQFTSNSILQIGGSNVLFSTEQDARTYAKANQIPLYN